MATDDDDAATLRERVRHLEQTVAQQQDTIEQLLPSRRAILAGGAGLVGGAALTGQASAQSAAGQVGTSSEPVDVEAASVNADSVNTKYLASDHHYADGYSGSDPETRLSNAISAATDGDTIYLENTTYSADLTTNKALKIVGSGGVSTSVIDTGTTWTFDNRVWIECVRCVGAAPNLQINANFSVLDLGVHGTAAEYAIQIAGDNVRVSSGSCSLLFESGTSGGLVDNSQGVDVTDNGTNTVGDNV